MMMATCKEDHRMSENETRLSRIVVAGSRGLVAALMGCFCTAVLHAQCEQVLVVASDSQALDRLGWAVYLDGDVAIAGAPNHDLGPVRK
jgi:FG-GAP repeat protein